MPALPDDAPMRFWRSSVCGKVECIDPDASDADDYSVGDSEPCICGDLKCSATVEELRATVEDPRVQELFDHVVDDEKKGQGSHKKRAAH